MGAGDLQKHSVIRRLETLTQDLKTNLSSSSSSETSEDLKEDTGSVLT